MSRSHFTKQFSIQGIRMRASARQKNDGTWKIVSVGPLDIPMDLLPFEISRSAMRLVKTAPVASANIARAIISDAQDGIFHD